MTMYRCSLEIINKLTGALEGYFDHSTQLLESHGGLTLEEVLCSTSGALSSESSRLAPRFLTMAAGSFFFAFIQADLTLI